MNSKFFVPYQTARQLKEKGYNGMCDYYYAPDKQLYFAVTCVSNDTLDYENNGTIAAPTYHEVMDWLEKKGYPIESACLRDFADHDIMWVCGCDIHVSGIYPTREEAFNDVILDLLKML